MIRTKRNGTIKIQDKNGAEVQAYFEKGDLKFDITDSPIEVLDRGALSDVVSGDDEPVKGSFSTDFVQFLKQATEVNPTIYEALTRTGAASSWVSTLVSGCRYAVKIIFEIEAPSCSAGQAERITFQYAYFTKIAFEEDDTDKISFEFSDLETKPLIEKF